MRAALVVIAFVVTGCTWEGRGNQMTHAGEPRRQDFGWSNTQHTGLARGELGGHIENSMRPAHYGAPIAQRTLEDRLVASGRLAITDCEVNGGFLFGWFNASTEGWRAPNSLVIRVRREGPVLRAYLELGTKSRFACGANVNVAGTTTPLDLQADGSVHAWRLEYDPTAAGNLGAISLTFDGATCTTDLPPGHKADGATFDRFGLLDFQILSGSTDVYFGDLDVDGARFDLSRDPGWQGRGNRDSFTETELRPYQDFGFRQSAYAAGTPGEIGGLVFRVDVPATFFAATAGNLTVDRELHATGKIAIPRAATDGDVYVGWFSSQRSGVGPSATNHGFIGFQIGGSSRAGIQALVRVERDDGGRLVTEAGEGFTVIPGPGMRDAFSLAYGPTPAGGNGRVELTLGSKTIGLDLRPGVRAAIAGLDRFGILAADGADGNYIELFLAELSFTTANP
ncbi:MAG: hypothetical protein ACAI25_02905 [Planctomycetota bacterium]